MEKLIRSSASRCFFNHLAPNFLTSSPRNVHYMDWRIAMWRGSRLARIHLCRNRSRIRCQKRRRKSRFLFGGRLAIYWSRRPSICQETLFFSLCSDKQRCYTRGGSTSRWSGITSWESGHRVWAPNTGILGFSWNHNNQRPTTRETFEQWFARWRRECCVQ